MSGGYIIRERLRLSNGETLSESEQFPRNQFLSNRINVEAEGLQRSCPENRFFARLAKRDRHRSFATVNRYQYGCYIPL